MTPRRTSRIWRSLSTAIAAAAALVPASARAQTTTTFAVDRLVMAGAPGDGFAVWRPDVAEEPRFFGQLGLGLSVNPLRTDNYVNNTYYADKIRGNPVSSQFIVYANAGVELLHRVSIQLAFPLVAHETGNPTNTAAANLPQPSVDLQPVAAGDLRLDARVVIFRNQARSFKLALSGTAYFPTGNKLSFAGDNGFGGSFGFAAEYDAKIVAVTLNAAYRFRPTVTLHELVVSSEVIYGVGAYVPLRKGAVLLGAEFFGGFGAGGTGTDFGQRKPKSTTPPSNIGDLDTTPLEWMLNGRLFFTAKRQAYAGLGVGSRLDGGYAPDFRAVALVGGWFGPR